MNMIRYIYICIASLMAFAACAPSAKRAGDGVAITDRAGREVVVPAEVSRVVGLRAGTLRLLAYMEAVPLVVGIEEGESRSTRPYLDAYPELLSRPFVGPMMGGDAEAIAAVRPDVIFTSYVTSGEADALARKTGIPVVVIDCPEIGLPEEREALYESLRLMGKILHKEERAEVLIAFMEEQINDLAGRTASLIDDGERPTAYVGGISYSGMRDIASTQVHYPPFLFTSTRNVAAALDQRRISHVKGTYIDKEQLLVWNPDVLFIDEAGLSLALNDLKPGGALSGHLRAVDNGEIYTLLPYNNYAINYELVLLDGWQVGKVLYPTAFADIDIRSKGDEITAMFLGRPMYDRLTTKDSFRRIDAKEFDR